ncbi:MAG: hypothetical protein IAF38_09440 [Bacteroidia bacterium]|nr:hypothetical protein [Bacteroidia bacterium]
MIRKLCLAVYIVFFVKIFFGQQLNGKFVQNADSMVATLDLSRENDIDYLTDTLTTPFKGDSLKVRAIYFWITEHIRYDCKKYREYIMQHYEKQPEDMDNDQWEYKKVWATVKHKKGVCQDYAELFNYMCKEIHVPCEIISGFASDNELLLKLKSESCLHAWNAVMINKKWYLLDVCWASGSVEIKSDKFIKGRNDFYYLTPPEKFSKTHWPENKSWFLLPEREK